ncbi:MAG: Isoprenyl transferase [Candidatus Gottesmanbacteria bacterium GW2011_GWA1_34_13]|uniref:Isoprenyl transferase n=1 Tax=Candidatus Gottesmanbacteria bacterium GW2011_GWA1_34_13 TaxID=1618434 RepID=A0A0G0D611_9BACT|nr:MAG: Isoprenyl transferase [Candidatus Gottesmanbacteria bacterium GW2011_GWA1_34_13]
MIIPNHIAIIMDGNRRWAKERHLPIISGHKRVADEILEPLVEYAAKKGIKYLTFWAWSTENWQRQKTEVTGIMKIFKNVIAKRWQRLHEKGVKIKVIGDISKFDESIKNSLESVVEQTKNNQTITVVFALNYGGRDEIIRAVNKWHITCHPGGKPDVIGMTDRISNKILSSTPSAGLQNDNNIKAESRELTVESFNQFIDTSDIPDPEIIVRTGGEQRLSGFLPWQSQYSELYFPKWYMPVNFISQNGICQILHMTN